MITNRWFTRGFNYWFILLIVTLLVAALVTSANVQQGQKAQPYPDVSGSTLQKPMSEYTAEEALVYRWQAMARYYKQHGLLTGTESQLPQTGSALQKSLTEYDTAEASGYRWQAMARYYKQHGLLTRAEP